MRYRVHIQQDEDGVFVAEVPSLPGCLSQGRTREEAVANVREAMVGQAGPATPYPTSRTG